MNIFNDAIEAHAEWKLKLKKDIESGHILSVKEAGNSHACELGKWIYGEGLQYNRLPSFESVCYHHDYFHRAAAEVVHLLNAGARDQALSLIRPDGLFAQSSNKLVRALMECSNELSREVVKGVRNTEQVRDLLESKESNEVYFIQSSASVFEALRMMVSRNIGALAVYSGKDFAGIFTERSYAQNIVSKVGITLESSISHFIDPETVCVHPDDSVEQCMIVMTSTHKRHLPVIEGGVLKGIISIGDVVKHVTREDRERRSQIEGYIHGHYGASA